jgi:hypothetical protein
MRVELGPGEEGRTWIKSRIPSSLSLWSTTKTKYRENVCELDLIFHFDDVRTSREASLCRAINLLLTLLDRSSLRRSDSPFSRLAAL